MFLHPQNLNLTGRFILLYNPFILQYNPDFRKNGISLYRTAPLVFFVTYFFTHPSDNMLWEGNMEENQLGFSITLGYYSGEKYEWYVPITFLGYFNSYKIKE